MKKILISLSIIVAVAAIVVGVTTAFFSDTETSTGNTFSAGSIDLILDIDGVIKTDEAPIFNLTDMKPGDLGEKTISLTVNDNPACGFLSIDLTEDTDNTCTEPELLDEPACKDSDPGELNDQVEFAVWKDDGDNVYEVGETIVAEGNLTGDQNWAIGELSPVTQYYGVGWCFGDWKVTQVGNVMKVKCDGSLINNAAQSDSFKGDLVITANQKRNQYPDGCPADVTQMATVNLENKDEQWIVIAGDNISGSMQYSVNDATFHGTVTGMGLVPDAKYQITLNGSGSCTATDNQLATAGSNLFQSGYWNVGPGLDSTCVNASNQGQGIYNMSLINDEYTTTADASGNINYPFNLNLPNGTYTDVKVLVKKTLVPFVSPWTDPNTVHTTNLFEVAPISFTVL